MSRDKYIKSTTEEVIKNNDDNVSGLNLEIARNLVLIQKGSFDLDIEADLFKVKVSFPVIEEKGGNNCD